MTGRAELWAAAMVRWHGIAENPVSLRMARALLELARRADAGRSVPVSWLRRSVDDLRDCWPSVTPRDEVRAWRWERRAQGIPTA